MLAAVFEDVHRSSQVVLDDLAAGATVVDASEDAWIGCGVDHDIGARQRLEVRCQTYVTVMEVDAKCAEDRTIPFASWPNEVVESDDRMSALCGPVLDQCRADEATGSGYQNPHETSLCCQASTICVIVCSTPIEMSHEG